MKIVLDTLGGDNPPQEIIRGGVQAAQSFDIEVIFAGDRQTIETELRKHPAIKYSIIHAPEAITMGESPAEAVRKKKNSSLVKGIEAVRDCMADAFVSPANTGAVMAAALLRLGRIKGIERPGIAGVLPTLNHKSVLVIDVGANVNCSPHNLFEFALMGSVYATEILEIPNPSIGLLNIGEESTKGNKLSLKAYELLEELPNFAGNIESNKLLFGEVDVVACDGFVGNVMLKAYEGGVAAAIEMLKHAINKDLKSKLGVLYSGVSENLAKRLLEPSFKSFKWEMSASKYGGAPLLGVRGIVIIAHGHSDAEAIKNAIRVAKSAIEHKLVDRLEGGITNTVESLLGPKL